MKRVIVAALALVALAAPDAMAQSRPKLPALPAVPCIGDTNLPPGCKQSATEAAGNALVSALAKPFNDIADLINADTGDAVQLATQIPTLQDGNGQACWIQLQSFAAVIKAHPIPLTLKLASDIEALRLATMAVNQMCANTHCTQVFADLTNTIQSAAPAPLPIPSLNSLCSKVPQIPVVPPTQTAATATPAPANAAAPAAPKAP